MKENHFFENQTISSKIKASIISEYFPSYCSIIASKYPPKQIRYIDLFAGPGVYEDGNASTPILVARHCSKTELLRENVKMIFNDNYYHEILKSNFIKEFPAGTFKQKVHFGRSTVGESEEITQFLIKNTHCGNNDRTKNDYPSLLFIDPFGYKGIETRVLAEFLKNWGNEIFIFVNTKRIHPALENNKFEDLMKDLFPTTFNNLKLDRRFKSTVPEKLNLIIERLGDEYKLHLGKKVFYTAFKFQEEDSDATSHYILHITKGARGYDLIKTIYNDFANVGTVFDGVNTYTFDAKKYGSEINELFDDKSANIEKLADDLLEKYKGKRLSSYKLFEEHQTSGLYSRFHYTEALRKLVEKEKTKVIFMDNIKHRKSVLISKNCILNFN